MDRIGNDSGMADIAAKYGITVRQEKISQSFSTLLHSVASENGISPLAVSSGGSLTDDLNAALSAYGIDVPPSLRITANGDKLALDGDYRNNAFQTMLNDRPDLRNRLGGLFAETQSQRNVALNAAVAAFGGDAPDATMQNFLDSFQQADKSTEFSIKFDGGKAAVQERGDNGWGPVQNKNSFMAEMLAAYTRYLAVHGISTESKKDDPADLQLKQELAKTVDKTS